MPRVRHAVGGRWAFEEHERRRVSAAAQRFVVDVVVVPELQDLFFKLGELGATGGGAKGTVGS